MSGRPLRFMAMTLGTWTVARVALLWPTIDSVPALIRAIAPPAEAIAYQASAPRPPAQPRRPARASTTTAPLPPAPPPSPPLPSAPEHVATPPATVATPPDADPRQPPPLRLPAIAPAPSRVAISIWGVARSGVAEARPGNQLGGSQAGLRATYALDTARRLALSARLSSGLDGTGREAAIGLDWQPVRAPVHLIAEQRIALGGGRGGPALFVVAGLDPHAIGAGLTVEGYAQGGAVHRARIEPFADAATRLTRDLRRFDLGVGAWAGAQRGAARLDVGPTAALRIPNGIRLTLDWRHRIAGAARPGSGPVLTIGADF